MNVRILPSETAGFYRYNTEIIINSDDLTQTATNTAQTIVPFTLQIGESLERVAWELREAFEDTADAAFNATGMQVLLAAGSLIASTELNRNGTELFRQRFDTIQTPTVASAFNLTFTSMLAKSLVNLNKGIICVFVQVLRPGAMSQGI